MKNIGQSWTALAVFTFTYIPIEAVFCRRLRHTRYMTTIMTVRRNKIFHALPLLLHMYETQKRLQSICGNQKQRFNAFLLTSSH